MADGPKRTAISRRLKARTRFGDHAKGVKKQNTIESIISQKEVDRAKHIKP